LDRRHERAVENHLLSCSRCREHLLTLKSGHKLAGMLPTREPLNDNWPAIEAALGPASISEPAVRGHHQQSRLLRASLYRRIVWSTGMLFMGAGAMAGIQHFTGGSFSHSFQERPAETVAFDARNFYPVTIDNIRQSDQPHVVAEGYVSDVSVDSDDGDLTFKLVEQLDHPGPFVICEIIDSTKLAPPKIGSKVKVYGVSRYDAKADHQWYEVHPVIDIEPASR
jgi:hypothetical protein